MQHSAPALSTDAVVIGAGPCGLFAVFQLGINGLRAHVIDALDRPGGQCTELYPAKPIFDIPGFPKVEGQELTDRLMMQASPFRPVFHFHQVASRLDRLEAGGWRVTTSLGVVIEAPVVVIASGGGSFTPKRPPNLPDLALYEGTSVHYSVRDPAAFAGKRIVIAGGGDSAADWALALADVAAHVTLIHHRPDMRAQAHSVERLTLLSAAGHITRRTARLKGLRGHGGLLEAVVVEAGGLEEPVAADHLLVFYGLTMKPGPVAEFGIKMEDGVIPVDSEKFQTSLPGVFAIGDISYYPGKLKLILSGFHEAALMARGAAGICRPGEQPTFEYTTSASRLETMLRVA